MSRLRLVVAANRFELPEDQDLPEWYTVFPDGVVELEGDAPYLVDQQAFDELMVFLARRRVDIPWDWNHASIIDGAEAPAYGWSRWQPENWRYVPGVGIQARAEWLDETAEQLRKGQARYHSPVFFTQRSDNRLVAIHSIALTNTPKHNGLQALIDRGELDSMAASFCNFKNEEIMDLQRLIAMLGLAEGSTEQDVTERITALKAAADEEPVKEIPEQVIAALGASSSDVSTVVASIHALKQTASNGVTREAFEALQLKMAQKEAEDAVKSAIEVERKLTPAQKDWALKYATSDLEGFKKFIEMAPAVGVPKDRLPNAPKDDQDDGELSEASLKIASLMGNNPEDVKKYNKKRGKKS